MHILKESGQNKVAEEIIRGTKIGSYHEDMDKTEQAYDMFSEIHEFVSAACSLYKSGKLTWDKAMDELVTVCGRMKGKEKVLKDAVKKEEDSEGDDSDE